MHFRFVFLNFLTFTQFDRQLVHRIGQLSNFILLMNICLNRKIAVCQFVGNLRNFPDRRGKTKRHEHTD